MSLNTRFFFSCVLSSKCPGLVIKYHLAKKKKKIFRLERLLCSSSVSSILFSHYCCPPILQEEVADVDHWCILSKPLRVQKHRSHRHLWSFSGLEWRLWVWQARLYSFYSIWFSVINTKGSYCSVVTAHQDKPFQCVVELWFGVGFCWGWFFSQAHQWFFWQKWGAVIAQCSTVSHWV